MNLNDLLTKTVEYGASDLHICAGVPPIVRVYGELINLNEPILTPHDCVELAKQCLSSRMYERFLEIGEVDSSYSLAGASRFRVNVFKQRGTCAIAFRTIPAEIPVIEDLGLPGLVYDLSLKQRGLILITGPTGHGKSTTLAAMINYINSKRKCHIVTIEDPIEFLHKHNKSIINQREIGSDTKCYANALRAVLREDPDVILIGEMRDQETIATALTAAETGHLVLSTLHTIGSAKTIDRIIDVFPPHQQAQVRTQLSTVLMGIISQQLLKRTDNKGRVLATETMVWTPAIANLIRESRTHQINTCIQTGSQFGMYTMDSCLADLYKQELIDYETACQYSVDMDNLRKLLSK
jgi:twitching motility protein PilT